MVHITSFLLLAATLIAPVLGAPAHWQRSEVVHYGRELHGQQARDVERLIARGVVRLAARDFGAELTERKLDANLETYLKDANPDLASAPTWGSSWMPLHGEGRKSSDGEYHIYTMLGTQPSTTEGKGKNKKTIPGKKVYMAKVATGETQSSALGDAKGLEWLVDSGKPTPQMIFGAFKKLAGL